MELKKADLTHRFLAKFIDGLIASAFTLILFPVGILMGMTYLVISDGLFGGRSLGKRIIGLRVVRAADGGTITFKESLTRNALFGLIILFSIIPVLGWILILTVGLLIIIFEIYYCVVDPTGQRVGDLAAGTMVVDEPKGNG
jgi:uncharacterized RDD family membrane protein YckC